MGNNLKESLEKYFGYSTFRECQEEIITSVLEGRDTLALLPTGAGKSLTYQLPTLHTLGLCLVVTPLIALMKDQADSLRRKCIRAEVINSTLNERDIDRVLDNCIWGDVRFLYVSPERLSTPIFKERFKRMPVTLIAVDEAHCISQWGYDFRPSYLSIAQIRELHKDVPVLALTASATKKVRDDIKKNLCFRDGCHEMLASFRRENLSFCVRICKNKDEMLLRVLEGVPGAAIVYTCSRNRTEKIAQFLHDIGIEAGYYHAGLSPEKRAFQQQQWMEGKKRVMVATSAFGMGIDRGDVRCVIHYDVPSSLEEYYQQAGRAGRDRKKSYAVLLSYENETEMLVRKARGCFPKREEIKQIYCLICEYLGIAYEDAKGESFPFSIEGFASKYHISYSVIRSAIEILTLNGYIYYEGGRPKHPHIRFLIDRGSLYRFTHTEQEENVLEMLMRNYEGIFTDFQEVDTEFLSKKCSITLHTLMDILSKMWKTGIIRYIPSTDEDSIFFAEERLRSEDLFISHETFEKRLEGELQNISEVERYIHEKGCRSLFFEKYFGKEEDKECKICDRCIENKRSKK
ncbi:MAG: ATP-dependent DNA helicase RecQ [Alistipes sp.]|nr:ATP-dependent DNA helicase RecQ [Candidatus Alistipes equi]